MPLSSFTASELVAVALNSLFSVLGGAPHFPVSDSHSKHAPSPFPLKESSQKADEGNDDSDHRREGSHGGGALRVLASWAGGFCLLRIHFHAFCQLQPYFALNETISYMQAVWSEWRYSPGLANLSFYHVPSLLHPGWTHEPGKSAVSTETEIFFTSHIGSQRRMPTEMKS